MQDSLSNLASTIESLRRSMTDRDSWMVSKSELEDLGFDEARQAKIHEMGESTVKAVSESMEIYLNLLKEIADSQRWLGKLAVPQKKLAEFLIEDFQEKHAYLKNHSWFNMVMAPDVEERHRKWQSHINAQRRKQKRLINAYQRYLPTVTAQLQKRISDLKRQIAEYDRQAAESKSYIAHLEQQVAEKQQEIDTLETSPG